MGGIGRNLTDMRKDSFVECDSGSVARRVKVCNGSGDPVPVTGTLTVAEATTPTIYNVASPGTANTEFSQALNDNTKKLMIRVRGVAVLKFSFTSGQSGTLYVSIPPGANYCVDGLNISSQTLYMQCNKASQTVEVIEWT